jgi:hypothetical protein
MHIIEQSPLEFSSNKILLSFYTKRQLLAIYELLLDDNFSGPIRKLLLHNNLILIRTEEHDSSIPGFTETIYIIETIKERT